MQQGKQLLAEINEARAHPQECIDDIKQQMARFISANVMSTRKGQKMRVMEGKAAWQDAILYLERAKPKEPLNWSKQLAETAHAYLSIRKSSDPNPFKLLKSRFDYEASVSFNVNETELQQTLRQLVIAMIVGDGDEKRGNRTTLFHPSYTHFGAVIDRSSGLFVPMYFSETGKFSVKVGGQKEEKTDTKGNKSAYIDRGRQLIVELNRIRKDPKSLINALKADLSKFKDDKTLVKDNVTIKTKQGRVCYEDLISQLEEQYPIPLLKVSDGLCMASSQQVLELQMAEGQKMQEPPTNYTVLIKKYCAVHESINNIIMNRSQDDPYTNMLILLLVGDGDKKRSARRKLLSPVLKIVGAAVGQTYFVINIGESARDNKEAIEQGFKVKKQSPIVSPQKVPKMEHKMEPEVRRKEDTERVIKKKTTKSTTVTRGGKHYKQTVTKILFADGETEEVEEEQLIQ